MKHHSEPPAASKVRKGLQYFGAKIFLWRQERQSEELQGSFLSQSLELELEASIWWQASSGATQKQMVSPVTIIQGDLG